MSERNAVDLRNSEFIDADMSGGRFESVDLSGSNFRNCDLSRVVMRGVEIVDTTIDGDIDRLIINGVDVVPLIEDELDRRYPDRVKFRPTSADEFREAWDLNEQLWATTVARARQLTPALLHQSVDGEWSFIQTLRHLAFATESWVGRCLLGDMHPWQPLSLPWDQMSPRPGVPHDRDAQPSLDEALVVRRTAMALMRGVVDGLNDEQLEGQSVPLVGPGWPDEGDEFAVRQCLRIVLNEEWWHHIFAERDLAILEERN